MSTAQVSWFRAGYALNYVKQQTSKSKSFARALTPAAAAAQFNSKGLRVQRLDLTTISASNKLAYVVHNVLSQDECKRLIEISEGLGYTPATLNRGQKCTIRSNYRLVAFDYEFAAALMDRLVCCLPAQFQGRQLSCLNERIKVLRYTPGQEFAAHYDGVYSRPDGSESSLLTVQLFLNEDFEGGHTIFYDTKHDGKGPVPVCFRPRSGSVLVFQKTLLHAGSILRIGTKYTIRTGVFYRNLAQALEFNPPVENYAQLESMK